LTLSNPNTHNFPRGRRSFAAGRCGDAVAGINDAAIAVGFYQVTPTDITHGLTYDPVKGDSNTLDDPNRVGATVLNGINDKGQAFWVYEDAAGNTHGMPVHGVREGVWSRSLGKSTRQARRKRTGVSRFVCVPRLHDSCRLTTQTVFVDLLYLSIQSITGSSRSSRSALEFSVHHERVTIFST
jgi:hypothetical protein